ncbi:MAG: hypothetical protein WCV72_01405 [Patescibacteria group bacterium]|jgi:hypothetical protein
MPNPNPTEKSFVELSAGLSERPLGHHPFGFDALGEPFHGIVRSLSRAEMAGKLTEEVLSTAKNQLDSKVVGPLGNTLFALAADIRGCDPNTEGTIRGWQSKIDTAFKSNSLPEKIELITAIRDQVIKMYEDHRSKS